MITKLFSPGTADIPWADNSSRRVLINIIYLCSLNIALLVLGVICFFLAWRMDTLDLKQSITNYSVAPPTTQRTSRTPQEIFDECAHLLGHHNPNVPRSPYHSRPPKYYDPSQQRFVPRSPNTGNFRTSAASSDVGASEENVGYDHRTGRVPRRSTSRSSLLDRQGTLSTASERSETTVVYSNSNAVIVSSEILQRYNYAIPRVKETGNARQRGVYSLLSQSKFRKMIFAVVLVLSLTSSTLSFEFTSTTFLSMVEAEETLIYSTDLVIAIRKGSTGLLLAYAAFVVGLFMYCKFQDRTGKFCENVHKLLRKGCWVAFDKCHSLSWETKYEYLQVLLFIFSY